MTTQTAIQTEPAAPAALPENVEIIDIENIRPSKTNPRKHNKKPEADFVDSIRVHGVLQPIVVVVAEGGGGFYDIVFGEMRWTASKLAGRVSIPAIVRDMEPDEIFEQQIIENSQRLDPHPLDESDAFAELVKRNYSLERIAARIGRPPTYVAQRLKLRELGKDAREALDEERITLTVALQIARIPEKLQPEALEEVGGDRRPGDGAAEDSGFRETLTSKGAAKALRDRFMLQLADAKFDRADPKLVSKAGPCTTCPKRTGNQGELFSDIDSPDLCTDPVCFRSKNDAQWKLITAQAKKGGQAILSDAESKKLWPYKHSALGYNSKFVALDGELRNEVGRATKVKAVLGADAPPPTLARNPHTGQIVELVPRAVVDKARDAKTQAKHKKPASSEKAKPKKKPRGADTKAALAKLKADAAKEALKRVRVEAATAISGMKGETADALLFPLLIRELLDGFFGAERAELLARYGAAKPKGVRGDWEPAALQARAVAQGPAWARGLLLELAIGEGSFQPVQREQRSEALFKALGVDRKAIAAEVLAEAQAAAHAPAPTGKPGVCAGCGCTDDTPCVSKSGVCCSWITPYLCSACHDKAQNRPAAKPKPAGTPKKKPKKARA